jgi:hypothetical protein
MMRQTSFVYNGYFAALTQAEQLPSPMIVQLMDLTYLKRFRVKKLMVFI